MTDKFVDTDAPESSFTTDNATVTVTIPAKLLGVLDALADSGWHNIKSPAHGLMEVALYGASRLATLKRYAKGERRIKAKGAASGVKRRRYQPLHPQPEYHAPSTEGEVVKWVESAPVARRTRKAKAAPAPVPHIPGLNPEAAIVKEGIVTTA